MLAQRQRDVGWSPVLDIDHPLFKNITCAVTYQGDSEQYFVYKQCTRETIQRCASANILTAITILKIKMSGFIKF